jgi:hypothetical protein
MGDAKFRDDLRVAGTAAAPLAHRSGFLHRHRTAAPFAAADVHRLDDWLKVSGVDARSVAAGVVENVAGGDRAV